MKVSTGYSQPEIAAAAFLVLYMVLGIDHFNREQVAVGPGVVQLCFARVFNVLEAFG